MTSAPPGTLAPGDAATTTDDRHRALSRLVVWLDGNDARQRRQQLVIAFVVYACVALVAYLPVYPGDSSRVPSPGNADAIQDTWFLGWTAYALRHGSNLFYTTLINVPFGINTAQNTQMPLLGLIASPLTLAANPLASYTLLMWLAFPLSALSATFVLLRWCNWFPAALLGGTLYGFGPYLVNEGVSHLNLMFVPFPPLILMAAYELFVCGRRPIFWGCWLGIFLVLQYYVSPEIAASSVLVMAISLVLLGILRWRSALPALRSAAPGLVAAAVLVGLGLASPVWWMLEGVGHYSGRVSGPGDPFHADLLGAFIPTSGLRFYPASWRAAGSALLVDNTDENGSFLGVPLLALVIGLVWMFRRNRWLLFGSLLLAVAYLASMGPRLTIDGHNTPVYLPLDAIANLRLGEDILPSRMSNYVMLAAAFVVSLALAEWHRTPSVGHSTAARSLIAVGVVVTLVSLVPAWPYAGWSSTAPDSLLSALRRDVPVGSTVLAYPYPTAVDDEAMLWQSLLGMRFRLVGGYALNPSASGLVSPNPPMLTPAYVQAAFTDYPSQAVFQGSAMPLLSLVPRAGVRQFLVRNGIDAVVVDRESPAADEIATLVTSAVGAARFENAGVEIWLASGHNWRPS